MHQYRFYSFHPVSVQDTLFSNTQFQNGTCVNPLLYLMPWLEDLPSNLILRVEIDSVNGSGGADNNTSSYFKQEHFSEISFEKRCRAIKCVENYTVTLVDYPIFFPNTDKPVIFDFNLTNYGDFITHFILEADFSLPCDLSIIDHETHRFHHGFDMIDDFVDSNHTHISTVYPLTIDHDDYIIFYVQAICSQTFDYVTRPELNLTVRTQNASLMYTVIHLLIAILLYFHQAQTNSNPTFNLSFGSMKIYAEVGISFEFYASDTDHAVFIQNTLKNVNIDGSELIIKSEKSENTWLEIRCKIEINGCILSVQSSAHYSINNYQTGFVFKLRNTTKYNIGRDNIILKLNADVSKFIEVHIFKLFIQFHCYTQKCENIKLSEETLYINIDSSDLIYPCVNYGENFINETVRLSSEEFKKECVPEQILQPSSTLSLDLVDDTVVLRQRNSKIDLFLKKNSNLQDYL
ncbi:hypothetical protein RF11_09923 [Thelohanellus kitauei]|uniref:Uncharacterized protein n=1 Tax=Thelohanellus kitauei TaxID=669202 RepID=A0A0C2N5A0_THEKT|nr:hypothetical protein RF11_09923 [Thelohanellus kitauei]